MYLLNKGKKAEFLHGNDSKKSSFFWADVTADSNFFPSQENAPCCGCVLRLLRIHITKGVLLFLAWKWWQEVFRELPADLHPPRGGGDRPKLRMIRNLLPKLGWWGLRHIFGLQCFTSRGLVHSTSSFSLFLAKPDFSVEFITKLCGSHGGWLVKFSEWIICLDFSVYLCHTN